ncbi:hypothetical protein BGZ47_011388 [Haplosporangium gracile]|nr:hypothetical protein BGZ47_011388 [Haplosporangium gracile]
MKFTAAFAALAVVALSSVSAQYTKLVNGTAYPTQYQTTGYSISPSPLCITKPFCLTATGTLSAPIVEGANYAITGRYLGRTIYTDKHDLCPLLASSGQACPIPAGPYNLNLCVNVKPNLPPKINYEYQFLATNGNGGTLFSQKTPNYPNGGGAPLSGLTGVYCD